MVTLNELCKTVGVSRRSIQGYESLGLMQAQGKNKYGYLLYSEESVKKARRIRFLQRIGFSLKGIRDFQEMSVNQQVKAITEKVDALKREEKEIAVLISSARQVIKELEEKANE